MMHEIEALLFIVGSEGLLLSEIAGQLQCSKKEALKGIEQLNEQLNKTDSALEVIKDNGRYLMVTRPQYEGILKQYAHSTLHTKISKAALEVLAIIAYKQPITRIEIDEIRGVQSAATIQKLLARQLVEVQGRVDGPGRPQIFGTSPYFLEYFHLNSLDDLPPLEDELLGEESKNEKSLFEQFNEVMDDD